MLKITNDILQFLDNGKCVVLVLLDMSAAFDTVDYKIFVDRLCTQNNVNGCVKLWMSSYLTERTQFVRVKGAESEKIPLTCGLPQGSYIGPTGFKAYIRPLSQIALSHGLKIHQYADDTQLYIDCEPDNISETIANVESCVEDMKFWLTQNCLKLNTDKTEMLLIGSRAKLSKFDSVEMRIGDDRIVPKKSVRNLGVIIDDTMSMENHVNNVCKQCYIQLRYLSRIRRFLTTEAAECLIHAFITSRLDGLNSLLTELPAKLIDKLQRIQNNAARLVLKLRKFDHISDALHPGHCSDSIGYQFVSEYSFKLYYVCISLFVILDQPISVK